MAAGLDEWWAEEWADKKEAGMVENLDDVLADS